MATNKNRIQNQSLKDPGARERLMLAAIDLFAENGYAGTSVREIVSNAGVTKPVLYYYFGNKEGLFQAIFEDAAVGFKEILDLAMLVEGSTSERLIGFIDRVYEGIREHKDVVRMIYSVVFGPKKGVPECDTKLFRRLSVDAVRAIYSEGMERGDIRRSNPETAADLLVSILDYSIMFDLTESEICLSTRPVQMLQLAFKGLEP